ncbi:hypothetical protein [Spirosoma aerolatum]|uniref:hypothetical protein n=1 Tax=Spirosoma aerolatum TaxID=1211326 RepID=UPI001FEB075A|nr:hypothetical protein [Spirosoma aerolatum]
MKTQNEENIIRAKKASSPDGLENQSAEGHSGVSNELPAEDVAMQKLQNDELGNSHLPGSDEPGENDLQ